MLCFCEALLLIYDFYGIAHKKVKFIPLKKIRLSDRRHFVEISTLKCGLWKKILIAYKITQQTPNPEAQFPSLVPLSSSHSSLVRHIPCMVKSDWDTH